LVKQTTAQPPPLLSLRQDIPRALALAVHTLLAKQPDDRPKTAAIARAMLERSLVQPARVMPEVEPLPSTVAAALSNRGSLAFRVTAPLLLLMILGALLFVFGYGGESAKKEVPRDLISAADAKSTEVKSASVKSPDARAANSTKLSLDEARRITSSISHGSIGDVAIVQTPAGLGIVAIHNEPRKGTTHFFIMEQRGARYGVSARGPLDNSDFRGATWKAETLNGDGDGLMEVLFTGTNASGRASDFRLVLYVPQTRQTYSLEAVYHGAKRPHMIWSSNASKADADPYRRLLFSRAKSIHAS
jgi:hypothetical protein